MQELLTTAELVRVSAGDPMIVWAGQGLRGGVRAWYDGDAVAVASPDLSKRDRLAVSGPVDAVARLVTEVYAEVGTSFRPFGDEQLIRDLADRVPGMKFSAAFGWMDTRTAPTHQTHSPALPHAQSAPQAARGEGLVSGGGPAWHDDDAAVEALLAEAAPASYAWPGHPAVRRWAAATGDGGELLSVAADAWSAPEVGFLAGVATRRVARGKGLSRQVCAFVTTELIEQHGRAALMVDADNPAAISVYHRLGYTYHPVAAAHM